ncbi:hypothetical protein, partial [Nocardia abscessus]|uniref:hypothetical protein n=1 Tax=Nocardia abscessus TaxID=120957 RepID=UPI00245472A8
MLDHVCTTAVVADENLAGRLSDRFSRDHIDGPLFRAHLGLADLELAGRSRCWRTCFGGRGDRDRALRGLGHVPR